MDKVEFAKFRNEFNVAQHLALCNGTLLLLFGGEWSVIFVKDYRENLVKRLNIGNNFCTACIFSNRPRVAIVKCTYVQHFWCGSQIHLEAWKSGAF